MQSLLAGTGRPIYKPLPSSGKVNTNGVQSTIAWHEFDIDLVSTVAIVTVPGTCRTGVGTKIVSKLHMLVLQLQNRVNIKAGIEAGTGTRLGLKMEPD